MKHKLNKKPLMKFDLMWYHSKFYVLVCFLGHHFLVNIELPIYYKIKVIIKYVEPTGSNKKCV